MSDLDDRIRTALHEAGAAAPDHGRVASDVVRRRTRRDRIRKLQAAGLALVVIAGTVAGYAALEGRFASSPDPAETPSPTESISPAPSVSPAPDGSTTIPGIPGRICRPMSIAGSFGDVGDEVVVYEEERVPGAGCVGSEGFQHVAILSGGEAVVVSDRVTDLVHDEVYPAWPFATPDIDGDGSSEIMLGFDGSREEGFVRIAPFAVQVNGDDVRITDLPVDCDVTLCDASQTFTLGVYPGSEEQGAYCGTLPGDPRNGLILWEIQKDPIRAVDVLLVLEGDQFLNTDITQDRESESSASQPNGTLELCGAPTYYSSDFEAPSPPATETPDAGRDIGLDFNVCFESGRQASGEVVEGLLTEGSSSTVWTGRPVKETGNCADWWLVAVDLTGDGRADAWNGPFLGTCKYTGCYVLDTADLDADGGRELIVHTGFSIVDHVYFSVEPTAGDFTIEPILVAAPGHPVVGMHPGEPLVTSAAGDAGYAYWISCESFPTAPVLVLSSVEATDTTFPLDASNWHETRVQLLSDGFFHVIGTNDFSLPAGEDPGLLRSEEPACGVDFNIWAPPNP